jgi:hypothetical protein
MTLNQYFSNQSSTRKVYFNLNSEEQAEIEKNMTDEAKLEFRTKVLGKKFNYGTSYVNFQKNINTAHFTKLFLFERLTQFQPIFNFFVYNVDKNIKKFSRGKSGKYVFI